jgi:hypothetical protein
MILLAVVACRGSQAAQRRMAYRRLTGMGVDADPAAAFQDFHAAAVQVTSVPVMSRQVIAGLQAVADS